MIKTSGITFKGKIDNINNLPNNAQMGDCYLINDKMYIYNVKNKEYDIVDKYLHPKKTDEKLSLVPMSQLNNAPSYNIYDEILSLRENVNYLMQLVAEELFGVKV